MSRIQDQACDQVPHKTRSIGARHVRKSWKRYTEEQLAFCPHQHELGTPVAEIIRKPGISEPMCYRWKKKFGIMGRACGQPWQSYLQHGLVLFNDDLPPLLRNMLDGHQHEHFRYLSVAFPGDQHKTDPADSKSQRDVVWGVTVPPGNTLAGRKPRAGNFFALRCDEERSRYLEVYAE